MEAIPYLSALSAFITIAKVVRDLFKRIKKDEEADAIEKAVTTIESNPRIEVGEARQTYEQALRQELGDDRAKPVIEYTNIIEMFFPFKPRGRVLHYGLAIEQLALEIHRVLYDLDTFKLFGSTHDSNRMFDFPQTAYSLRGQEITRAIVPDGDYTLSAFLFEIPPHDLLGGPKARFKITLSDYLVLKAQQHDKDLWIFVDTDEGSPFSLRFEAAGKSAERRLAYYEFGHLMSAMISDANSILEKAAQEYEQSKEEMQRFDSALEALKNLTKNL